jgi:hypothetical protein
MRRQRMCERLAAPLGTTDGVAGESASINLSRSKPKVSMCERSLIRGLQVEFYSFSCHPRLPPDVTLGMQAASARQRRCV